MSNTPAFWPAPLDPADNKPYVARFLRVIDEGDFITGTPTAVIDAAGTTAGVVVSVANPPTIVNDPVDLTSLLTAVEIYIHIPVVGDQSNIAFDDQGQIYNVKITIGTDNGATYQEDWLLTVKNSGAPQSAWTYNTNLSRNLDLVRFRIGDTNEDDRLVSDEEITALLVGTSITRAAIKVSRGLAARFSRLVSTSTPEMRVELSRRSKAFLDLATALSREELESISVGALIAGGPGPSVVVTGTSIAAMNAKHAEADRPEDRIRIGLHDNPNRLRPLTESEEI